MSLPASPSDVELLALARTGDCDAYGNLVSRHQTLVASVAYSICGDFARSEDVAQETFVSAWRQLASLEDPAKFKAWLCGIARNLANNFIRQQTRREDSPPAPAVTTPEPVDDAPGPREHAVTREESAIVWQSLETLPEEYRVPLILFYREHHSVERVAAALDLSEDAVKQRLSRGRAMMREQVEKLVERSLGFTTPGTMFTLAVVAAISTAAPPLAAAAAVGAAKAGSAAKAASVASVLPLLTGPLFTLASILFMRRENLRFTTTEADRKFVKRVWLGLGVLAVGGGGGMAVGFGWLLSHPGALGAVSVQTLLWLVPLLILGGLGALTLWAWRPYLAWARGVRLPAEAPAWRKRFWFGADRALAYRSRWALLGLPLLDIRFGHSPEEPFARGIARGWIAVGDIAHGVLFAFGGVAVGGIAFGGLAIGGISIGGAALGLGAFGGVAGGGIAGGMFVGCGYYAAGLLAIGYEAANGAMAFARHLAQGYPLAFAAHANDAVASRWFESSPLVRHLSLMGGGGGMFAAAFLIPVASGFATNCVIRHDREAGASRPALPFLNWLRVKPAHLGLIVAATVLLASLVPAVAAWDDRRFAVETNAGVIRAQATVAASAGAEDLARARYKLGEALDRAGRPAESLAEFLWCFDEGMVRLPGFVGTRGGSLLRNIRDLGDDYPPAMTALRARRDQAEENVAVDRLLVEAAGMPAYDVYTLNDVLNEGPRSLALYDRLAPANRYRATLGRYLFPQFLTARRYGAAIENESNAGIVQRWSAKQKEEETSSPLVKSYAHGQNRQWLADRIEALAGAGQLDHARTLLSTALAYDGSRQARSLYRTGLERAGQAELLDEAR